MPSGIALPLRAVAGRLQRRVGTEYVKQLVEAALGDDETSNPFQQDLALGESFLFRPTAVAEGEFRARVKAAFAELERDELARLIGVATRQQPGTGQIVAVVEWEDMESGQRDEVEVPTADAPL